MKAVILAGGLGTRLKPFTEAIPKPLLPIGEKAVLEIQIEHLKKYGFNEIYLATNYKSKYIENFFGDGSKFGVKLIISKEEKPLGTVGPLTILKDRLKEPFLLMNGDILSAVNFSSLFNFALAKKAPLTITVKKLITPFEFGNILFEKDFVTNIEEKPDMVNYIMAGIYVLTPEVFDVIPMDTYYGIDKLIEFYLKEKIPVAKYEINEYWLDIGRIADYEKAQEDYKTNFE
jgi:NDP-sugar pyrophosphorylase family protein